jgi:hypothetical protein
MLKVKPPALLCFQIMSQWVALFKDLKDTRDTKDLKDRGVAVLEVPGVLVVLSCFPA